MTPFRIAARSIGSTEPPYVIAEISANHRGSLAAAVELIHAAAESGADAVKLQHYTPDTITVRSDHPDFLVTGGTLWDGRQLADLYAEAMTPWEWTDDLAAAATAVGITWFSTPFDPTAADFLMRYEVPAFKIASFEIVDLPLIRYVAGLGKPVIMSTGMATLDEIDAAVESAATTQTAILRCNSGYPALPEEMDLRAIPLMIDRWNLPVGLSDHTLGSTAAIAAVALGACIVEKHLTLRRSDGGPDAPFSAEPDEFGSLVSALRQAHAALGSARFGPSEREEPSLAFRRSLRAARPIAVGTTLSADDVRSMRPAGGLPPDDLDLVIGSIARTDLAVGDPITRDSIHSTSDDR
jgi:N-acetylneuraminate synthase